MIWLLCFKIIVRIIFTVVAIYSLAASCQHLQFFSFNCCCSSGTAIHLELPYAVPSCLSLIKWQLYILGNFSLRLETMLKAIDFSVLSTVPASSHNVCLHCVLGMPVLKLGWVFNLTPFIPPHLLSRSYKHSSHLHLTNNKFSIQIIILAIYFNFYSMIASYFILFSTMVLSIRKLNILS